MVMLTRRTCEIFALILGHRVKDEAYLSIKEFLYAHCVDDHFLYNLLLVP
jgi:hypothetical protein